MPLELLIRESLQDPGYKQLARDIVQFRIELGLSPEERDLEWLTDIACPSRTNLYLGVIVLRRMSLAADKAHLSKHVLGQMHEEISVYEEELLFLYENRYNPHGVLLFVPSPRYLIQHQFPQELARILVVIRNRRIPLGRSMVIDTGKSYEKPSADMSLSLPLDW